MNEFLTYEKNLYFHLSSIFKGPLETPWMARANLEGFVMSEHHQQLFDQQIDHLRIWDDMRTWKYPLLRNFYMSFASSLLICLIFLVLVLFKFTISSLGHN